MTAPEGGGTPRGIHRRMLRRVRSRPRIAGALAAVAGLALAAGLAAALLEEDEAPPGPPPDRAAALVPGSARVYLKLGAADADLRRGLELLRRTPTLEALLLERALGFGRGLRSPAPDRIVQAVSVWAGREKALAVLGSGDAERDWVLLVEARDAPLAERSLRVLLGAGRALTYRSVRIGGRRTRFAVARGFAIVGTDRGVRRALDAAAGAVPALARDADYRRLRAGMPDRRALLVYASAAGLRQWAPGVESALAALSGSGGLRGAAAALALGDERSRIVLRAIPTREGGCGARDGSADLLASAPPGASGFLGLARPECFLNALTRGRGGIARGLRLLRREARREGISLERDMLPLLRGGAALIATGDESERAALTLVAGRAERERALEVLGRLQPALTRLADPLALGRAPDFRARQLGDVRALSASLAPGLELSYAATDDRFVVSSALDGVVATVAASGLGEGERVLRALPEPPESATALLFLDLDQLLALAEEAGVAFDTAYLAVRDDLQRLDPVGGIVGREAGTTTAELSFENP